MQSLVRAIVAIAFISLPTVARAAPCERVCLNVILDDFFEALAKHDTSRLALAPDVRVTENGAPAKVGEGLWQRAGEATYRLDAVDPLQESAVSNAVVPDGGRPVIFFVRLKVVDEKITEIETLVIRPGEGQRSTPEALIDPNPYHLYVPPSLQASREEMSNAAVAYLDSLATAGTDAFKPAPITDTARRVENGVPSGGAQPMSINDQLRRGFGADKLMVSDRRYPVLDEGRGILVMIGVMNLDTPARPPQTPGAAPTGPAGHAVQHIGQWKQILVEFFKVADGMIQEIQATVYDLDNPAIQSPGWPAVPGAR
ncbi:MAG: hypothetical protein ABL986_09815 [Vicinamibacterales bacterium]